MIPGPPPAASLARDPAFFALVVGSHMRVVGAPLVNATRDAAWLYEAAPFALLAHDGGADPRFTYANRTAQACFEYAWDEIVGLPSRLSAEAPERAARQRLLDAVGRDGFATGYRGVRVAKSGRRFWIEDGVVWQLRRPDGSVAGQAATFAAWRDA
ncbi:MEKHLA domain-containing protein [Methylobacterium sp. J-068]|uniref:MEKHLA domain-containing protein n=1 Tax=Methylobacterium sp. J-068 TaxID=2836649 RepID=UPI001FBA7956|nr:MEKHLA domain-containing protein [Methylobacterium sp. J-068]MCJ2033428.1 MEKHLA domain-containing protein [Methylobacterium sp. J-068]